MTFKERIKTIFNSRWFLKLTLFQGSTLRFLYSYLFLNFGKSPWICIKGSNDIIGKLEYNFHLEESRGRQLNGKYYSYGYQDHTSQTRSIFTSIIMDHLDDITRVLGSDFLINDPTFWRILHIPEDSINFDIYSQVFHQDSVRDNFNIQIFVLLQDIDCSHGPFEWIDKQYHRKAFNQCHKRNKVALLDIPICKLTGKKHDYLILSTGQTLHRDGIPDKGVQRIMASIALFPKYTNIGKPLYSND